MNRSDVADVVGVIRARYPMATWGPDDVMTVEAWFMSLGDLEVADVRAALQAIFLESRFAPDPTEIRARILADSGVAPEPGDAWGMVLGAAASYYPGFDNSHIKLPAPVQQAVRAIGGLHNIKASTDPQKDREAFLRVYGDYRKRALSETGLGLLALTGERRELPANTDG